LQSFFQLPVPIFIQHWPDAANVADIVTELSESATSTTTRAATSSHSTVRPCTRPPAMAMAMTVQHHPWIYSTWTLVEAVVAVTRFPHRKHPQLKFFFYAQDASGGVYLMETLIDKAERVLRATIKGEDDHGGAQLAELMKRVL
jgi:hypothetical protein